MLTGWRYRVVGAGGVVALVAAAVLVANHPVSQSVFTTYVPVFNRLEPEVVSGGALALAIVLSIGVIGGSLLPLYKPRPQRILDTVFLTHKRLLVGGFALATLGYYNWTYRIPRATLTMAVALLFVVLPLWFVWIRHGTGREDGRTLIVGDDIEQIRRIAPDVDASVIGYLCPTVVSSVPKDDPAEAVAVADGGGTVGDWQGIERVGSHGRERIETINRLGGLSRLEDVIVDCNIDTVVLAFSEADRAEFFGALEVLHEHGVNAKVHRSYADSVLISEGGAGDLVNVDIEPWDPLDHVWKRAFDVLFAVSTLTMLVPMIAVISAAIKLEDGGSVLYRQERTAVFGESFPVYKFRSMIENVEDETGAKISEEDAGDVDPRVTRVGRILRQTHLDEIPQLWSILAGDMSVVGPRPERPEFDTRIQREGIDWSKRWFVKPGLTGLAQINDVTGHEPAKKLRYDLDYVRRQSFWFDMQIVLRQIWKVLSDLVRYGSDE
ncbi:sugar transferase [Saliphagus infecundisoli]|uniref:Sugar transferase n=1 Tax=Saliphagus infecundisoli TaxID=1849069 RepID=A0ABD5QKX2_9EURY|nr:sugar transferase [Saliphagus infecundisoli]